MVEDNSLFQKCSNKYEMVPPEGGWGYIVTLAVSLIFIVTIIPITVFGMIFGPYLADLGNEIGDTSLITGVFNSILFLTGLPANHMLQKYTYRKVGLLGAGIFFIGSFSTIFATSVFHLVISYGILQGIGFGFLVASGFSAFHGYFAVRQNVMMSICQTMIATVGMVWPGLTSKLMDSYGFRGTVAIFAALSLNAIAATSTFQPAKWHYKMKNVTAIEMEDYSERIAESPTEYDVKSLPVEDKPLMEEKASEKNNSIIDDNMTGNALDKKEGMWKTLVKDLDLVLFKDPIYVNTAIGTSMAMTSDLLFIPIIPVLLIGYGFNHSEVTLVMTVYFTSDLIGRIAFSIASAVFSIWNRYAVLMGAILSVIFRIAFTVNYSFWWTVSISAILGFLRCFIQICFALIFTESYGSRFTTAFSLNMVVCGIITLSVGLLSGLIKKLTERDIMVVHLLTVVYALCAIPWLAEIFILRVVKRKNA